MFACEVVPVGTTRSAGKIRWGCIVSVLVALMIPGIVLEIAGLVPSSSERAAIDKLKAKVEQYASASGTPTAGTPHVTGRIVTVDVGEREIDEDVYIALPDALQAHSPKQVSTVVLIKYGQDVVGEYQGGDDAIQEFARITIVDLTTGEEFQGKVIDGPAPPNVKQRNASGSGGRPDPGEIAKYLKRLT